MIRFIQMWLMMRLLQDQEEHFILDDTRSTQMLSKGARASVGVTNFVAFCTRKSLVYAGLPSSLRKWCRPKNVLDYAIQTPNIKKFRTLHSLIRVAETEGYIEHGKLIERDGKLREQEDRIRISPSGDDFATYAGGVETFIKRYPRVWSIVAISTVPWSLVWPYLLRALGISL